MQVSLKVWGGQIWSLYNPFLVYCLRNVNLYHDLHYSVLRPAVVSVGHILLEGANGMLLKCHWLLHFKVYVNLLNKCWYICCLLFQSLEVILLYHMYLYVCVCTWTDVCVLYFVHMYVSSFVPGMGIWKSEDHLKCCVSATIDLTVLLPRNLASRVGWLSSKIQRSS